MNLSRLHRVRLVRACGSKQLIYLNTSTLFKGQARKSLWIETVKITRNKINRNGQARKSLWIETDMPKGAGRKSFGQARKSLWIETTLPLAIASIREGSGS